jgi:hypothetical protein
MRLGLRPRANDVARVALALGLVLPAACGCGRAPANRDAPQTHVTLGADTARSGRLAIGRPRAPRDPLSAVAPAPPPEEALPPPEAGPDSVPPGAPSAAAADPMFRPPILRGAPVLIQPRGSAHVSIDLDLRVDADGHVREVREVEGASDTAALSAARACALGMRFYPALRAGQPVTAWSRRRFEFGAR